jgi:hypothetical protein
MSPTFQPQAFPDINKSENCHQPQSLKINTLNPTIKAAEKDAAVPFEKSEKRNFAYLSATGFP